MNWFDRKIDEFISRIRNTKTPIPIGPVENPTYWRWFVIPRNPVFNIYLHNFLQDDATDLHDHRMINISFTLQGSCAEERFVYRPCAGDPMPPTYFRTLRNHKFTIRFAATPHRVVLRKDEAGKPIPMWSLFIGLPHMRVWGFWTNVKIDGIHPQSLGVAAWFPYTDIVSNGDPTSVGYGQNKI